MRLRRRSPNAELYQAIAITGWGQQQDKQRALLAGFDTHLTKPADPLLLESLLVQEPNATT